MTDRTIELSWTHNITEKTITRTVPHIYCCDQETAIKALESGSIVCITAYGDIAFTSYYKARAFRMAEEHETLVYPDGRVITITANAE